MMPATSDVKTRRESSGVTAWRAATHPVLPGEPPGFGIESKEESVLPPVQHHPLFLNMRGRIDVVSEPHVDGPDQLRERRGG
jgi:hypothetical protein